MNDHQAQNTPIHLAIGIVIIILVSTLGLPGPMAQTPPATPAANTETKLPVYDVVSVRPSKSGGFSEGTETSRDRYLAKNVRILTVIAQAYDMRQPLILGIPRALESDRFDIEAKVLDPDPAVMKKLTRAQHNAMLRPILSDRFKLAVHNEIKTEPVYKLVVAKGGPKFQQSPNDSKNNQGTNVQNTELDAHGVTMGNFAGTLTDRVQRTVIDRTGLAGTYDLTLKWSRDEGEKDDNGGTDAAPSIYTALQEQLGLKLQPAKGPVETLVIDHVEMPSEN